jgi:hypothetical protein
LQMCRIQALDIVRRRIPLPSREILRHKPPHDYVRSDLTNLDLAPG